MPKSQTETAVATLAKIAAKNPDIEATALWFRDGVWSDALGETLEAEEMAFYAEGLLDEGFGLDWALLNGPLGPAVRMCFWQGSAPSAPNLPADTVVVQSGRVDGRPA